jgi:hypothetical protein
VTASIDFHLRFPGIRQTGMNDSCSPAGLVGRPRVSRGGQAASGLLSLITRERCYSFCLGMTLVEKPLSRLWASCPI